MPRSSPSPPILKWIRCTVAPAQRESFARAQEAWSALSTVPGFLLQLGGWDSQRLDEAGILAVWRSLVHYEAFMAQVHDGIVASSGQERTYIHVVTRIFELAPAAGFLLEEALETLASSEFLRVALFPRRPGEKNSPPRQQTEISLVGIASEEILFCHALQDKAPSRAVLSDSLLKLAPRWTVKAPT